MKGYRSRSVPDADAAAAVALQRAARAADAAVGEDDVAEGAAVGP